MPTHDGYMGKILLVDLSLGDIREEEIERRLYEQYLGGTGLAAPLLYDMIPAGADPLGPDNVLCFLAGLLTGTGSLFAGRWMVAGKSPLTGGWGDANCGGTFAPAIKRSGYDGIFVKGISAGPVYLYVRDGRAELRDASHVWGIDAVEAETLLRKEAGGQCRVALIGPAGEKLSLISGICNDGGRIAARSGLGAVMGSKRLKAVVLDGHRQVGVFNRDEIKRLSRKCNRWVRFQAPLVPGPMTSHLGVLMRVMPTQMAMDGMVYKTMLTKWGTCSMNQVSIEMGDAPIRNWEGSSATFGPDKSVKVNPDVFAGREKTKYHCYSCPLGCGGICTLPGGDGETHKPEYETILALGGLCGNEDPDSIFYMNEILNRAGMDTISAGGTAAFAIECFERGILTRDDTGGLELTWGNTKAVVALIEKMIRREGIGDILADGSRAAAAKIGREAGRYAIHAGGQELGMHDGRNDPGFNVHYAVEPTPGRHTLGSQLYYEMFQLWKKVEGLPKPHLIYSKNEKYRLDEKKAATAAACSKFMNVVNGAGLCLFGVMIGAGRTPTFEWLNAATGWRKTPAEYIEIGARIQTVKQLFNIKHGIDPRAVKMNERVLGKPAQAEGANKGRSMDLENAKGDYWRQFGWDAETGRPTAASLAGYGINLA